MMETKKDDGRELARAALAAWRKEAPCTGKIDAMQVAAWLEGRLDETSASNVELMLAADPDLLDAILAGNTLPVEATHQEIETARALVRSPWWQRFLPAFDALQARLGTAVAATVLVASVGTLAFELGEAYAGMSIVQQSAAMRSMMNNDLFDTLGEK